MSAEPDIEDMDRRERAALWCLTMAEGEMSFADRDAFDLWMLEPGNAIALSDAIALWDHADLAGQMPEVIRMRGAALESLTRANRLRWTRPLAGRWRWAALAAVLVIAAAVPAILLLQDKTAVYRTDVGERRLAVLADGSKISLDADTEVDVRLHKNRRDLTLVRGRAKFDVAKDPLRPFTVIARNRLVVATGTSFSVELLNNQVRVLLYEGHVAVLDQSGATVAPQSARVRTRVASADQLLTPDHELVVPTATRAPASIVAADDQRSLSWEGGQLSFEQEPLEVAVERVNRYSKDKLSVGDPRAAGVVVTGVFNAGDTGAFVEGVTALNPVLALRNADNVVFRSK